MEADESEKTLSLMSLARGDKEGGEAPELELESMKPGSKLLSSGTLLIVAVFVLGAGTLLVMRVSQKEIGRAAAAAGVEQTIKEALVRLTQAPENGADGKPAAKAVLPDDAAAIVQTLRDENGARQVPVEYLKKNPFALPVFKEDKPVEAVEVKSADAEELKRKRKQLEQEFGKLELQSIVQGPRPVAIINGEIVQAGQVLGSFVVQSIDELSVVLEHEGEEFRLKMKGE